MEVRGYRKDFFEDGDDIFFVFGEGEVLEVGIGLAGGHVVVGVDMVVHV